MLKRLLPPPMLAYLKETFGVRFIHERFDAIENRLAELERSLRQLHLRNAAPSGVTLSPSAPFSMPAAACLNTPKNLSSLPLAAAAPSPAPAQFDYSRFPKKLNVGCGFDIRPGYLNIDMNDFHKPDLVADVKTLDMLPADYYEEIVAQDVLEHLPRAAAPQALAAWNRVLKPGGLLFLRVPSVIGLLEMFKNPAHEHNVNDHLALIQCLFGTQAYEGDWHYAGFTDLLLEHYLTQAGFIVREIKIQDRWLFNVRAEKSPPAPH